MKKFILFSFAITVLSSCLFAGTQFSPASGANIDIRPYSAVTPISGMHDTLRAAADSSTLWSMKTFEPGWIYLVRNGVITGGGSDSVKFLYRVDVYNSSKTHIGRYYSSDTVTVSTGSVIELPINRKCTGTYFTITALAATDNGGHVILNNLAIDRARYFKIGSK